MNDAPPCMTRHLRALVSSNAIAQAWEIHTARMATYGFVRCMYAFTRFRADSLPENLQDTLLLTTYDKEYMDQFLANKLYLSAPMLRWTQENTGSASWRIAAEALHAGKLDAGALKVIDLNRRFGITAGYTISHRPEGSARSQASVALAAGPEVSQATVDQIWRQHGDEIELLTSIFTLKIASLPRTTSRSLTKRQTEVLEWVADGKTTQDTAMILGLTPATVEKHLRLAREALDVDTTAQAVLKATMQNQIFTVATEKVWKT